MRRRMLVAASLAAVSATVQAQTTQPVREPEGRWLVIGASSDKSIHVYGDTKTLQKDRETERGSIWLRWTVASRRRAEDGSFYWTEFKERIGFDCRARTITRYRVNWYDGDTLVHQTSFDRYPDTQRPTPRSMRELVLMTVCGQQP